jgi:uncharacterized protein (UPF0335 family)
VAQRRAFVQAFEKTWLIAAEEAAMARKALAGNKIDPDVADRYVQRIEQLLDDIATMRAENAERCGNIREDIKEIYHDAREAGLAPKPLKALIRVRELSRKQHAVRKKLDLDQLAEFEQLVEALGEFAETPLGEAAVLAAEPTRA